MPHLRLHCYAAHPVLRWHYWDHAPQKFARLLADKCIVRHSIYWRILHPLLKIQRSNPVYYSPCNLTGLMHGAHDLGERQRGRYCNTPMIASMVHCGTTMLLSTHQIINFTRWWWSMICAIWPRHWQSETVCKRQSIPGSKSTADHIISAYPWASRTVAIIHKLPPKDWSAAQIPR